ncbi:MAG: DUF1800 family protein [Prosthecobacter sp.]
MLLLLVSPLKAEYETIWSLGVWDGNPNDGYGDSTWDYDPDGPGTTELDNDYYFEGTYPGLGDPPAMRTVTTEPLDHFEDGLDEHNQSMRLHFTLTAAQATSTARMRLNMHHVWGGHWDSVADDYAPGYGTNHFQVRWNGVVVGTVVHTHADSVIVEANYSLTGFRPVVGANVLEIRRVPSYVSGSQSSPEGWISFDALSLELDPLATQDADADGLPRWWEQDHGFSDASATDAAQDPDRDGRTNAQEFAAQTQPLQADSDNDGLNDGAELTAGTNPLKADTDGDTLLDGEETVSNPLLKDTDGDGADDAWELRTGFLANSAASTPPAQAGVIGIKFVSEQNPDNTLLPQDVTGLVPQRNWNSTWALTAWRSNLGTQSDIVSPASDVIVNSAGAATGVTMNWNFPNHSWANGQAGGSTQKLLDGYLNVASDTRGSLTLGNIPYATYDVLVYVGSNYDGAVGHTRLNSSAATDSWFMTASAAPQTRFIGLVKSDAVKPWRANVVRYRNVTGASVNVKIGRTSWHEIGMHGIQIIDSTLDTDADGMPDAFEWEHQLRVDVADATLDSDGDGLTNLTEMNRQTNPRSGDTDGDGLSDAVETNTGTWVNASNTGSNALLADTDGDGLGDGDEAGRLPDPTNPNLADTDGDGLNDAVEAATWNNPVLADGGSTRMPVVTTSPRTFTWTVEDVQIIWDHSRGGVTDQSGGDDYLMNFQIVNAANDTSDAFNTGIRVRAGKLTHFLYSGYGGAFSYPGNATGDIWEADWGNTLPDMRAALGFSGHGTVDISDRLRFKIEGSSPGARGNWSFTYTITNQDANEGAGAIVLSRTFNGCTLAQNVHNNNVTWQDRNDPANVNRLSVWQHDGVKVMFNSTPLENTPAYAAFKDTDEDGMPDVWENTNGLNPNSAADAALDGDTDGLSNLREHLAGTLPHDADSDDDLARDGLEVDSGSNPLLATSLPPLYRGVPAGVVGEDLNGNGMSDAWELWVGQFGLNGLQDADGDGMSNAAEAVAGTNPFDKQSRLWGDVIRGSADLTLRWPVIPLKRHRVMQSTDLGSWTVAGGSLSVVGNEYRQTFAVSGARAFYRASVSDLDTDNDGVSDWTEANVLGSSSAAGTGGSSTASNVSADVNGDGTPESTFSGDYATMVEQLQGAGAAGGFPGGGGSGTVSRTQAARFLMQASFGPTLEDIQQVQAQGYAGWITAQTSQPQTRHSDYIKAIFQDMTGPRSRRDYCIGGEEPSPFLFGNNMQTAFARAAIQGTDQLRQRVAFALSQILVASRRDANLENRCLGMADFYDIFVRHAFGNYEDVLMEVTMHPVMGRYLSHVGNQKADPSINRYPDENYAREVMQLFSVGLWELNPDGSRQLDEHGASIPTYSNTEITHMARVMTGFWFGQRGWMSGGWTEQDYATPMSVHADRHDFGAKTLLHGHVIPARAPSTENALRDVRDAIHHLFMHPNTGVFIGRQLIQFLVTDNPSPAYVQRVGAVFANNGSGVRGDLLAVVRAILLDDEARAPVGLQAAEFGRLKEPVIRAMAMSRVFGMKQVPDLLWWDWNDFMNESRQAPTSSPSVFNFYRPEYRAPGLPTQNNLATPVFQITDSYSSISFPNRLWSMLESGFTLWSTYRFPLAFQREMDLAASPERLMDHLNLLFCAGQMKASTRATILSALNQIPAAQTIARARVAAYLALTCPEGAVMR